MQWCIYIISKLYWVWYIDWAFMVYKLWCQWYSLYTLHQGNALNTALPMVICFFVGCMCAPCFKRKRAPQKTPQFREPIGNSMILCRAIRELFPSWSLANDQAPRSRILSMPASIRGRLDLLPEEYLQQFCAAPPPLPSVASADKEAVSAAAPPTGPAGAEAAARPPTPLGAAFAAQPVAVSAATSVATATTGRPVVQATPRQPLFTPVLPFGEPQWPLTEPEAPEPLFQLLPGPALPVGPVPVLPPLPSGPAPLSAPVPMEQDEEDLLLEEEVTSTKL